jgi:hypothetical protein
VREGLLAVGEGLLVVAEQGVVPADRVEGIGMPALVAGGSVQVEGLLQNRSRKRTYLPHVVSFLAVGCLDAFGKRGRDSPAGTDLRPAGDTVRRTDSRGN